MNTPLGVEQRVWLETELQKHDAQRLFVFLHLPPYLWDPAEPHRGHYDNLGQPVGVVIPESGVLRHLGKSARADQLVPINLNTGIPGKLHICIPVMALPK